MGTCHSHQPEGAVIGDNKRKSTKVVCQCRQEASIDPNKISGTSPSLESGHTELADVSHQGHHHVVESDPIPEEPIPTSISDFVVPPIQVPPIQSSDNGDDCLNQGSKHVRKKSGLVKDYFQSEGAASNRTMVQIMTPFGLPIEAVYDGVRTGEVLGEGIAGQVRRITHRDTGIHRAVKRLDLSKITRDEDIDRLLDEIKIMCCLDHPNVVCLEEVFEGENELFLTQELCEGGDMFDRLEAQQNECYTEARCAKLIRQIINSVSYLHSKDIIHRDLKLENFLFMDGDDDSVLKMIDFGLSKHFVIGEVQHESVGTPYTVAPEVILGGGYDEKCDVWGIGVITFLLLSGVTPFGGACEGDDLQEVKQNILSGEVSFDDPCWDVVSEEAIGFIKSMLVLDPENRPKANELQDHPWLKTMKRNSSFGSDESLSPRVVNGLVSFKELSSTRKFLREIISYTLQPDQISGLHGEFEKIDVDSTGEISLHCFKEALIANSDQYPLTEVEIEEIFQGLKVRNTDLSIRWHEFIAACLSQCHIDDRNLRLAFDRLDSERKGFITLKDLKGAMDFYGSDSQYDLQSMWINNIIDYRIDKDHMTYNDFYKLLKLDKDRDTDKELDSSMEELLRKSAPARISGSRSSLARSYIGGNDNGFGLDEEFLEFLTPPIDEFSSPSHSHGSRCRRHSIALASNLDLKKILLDDQEPNLVSTMKAKRDIHNFILEASKRVEEEKQSSKLIRKKSIGASMNGTRGLLMRRNSLEYTYLRTSSSDL